MKKRANRQKGERRIAAALRIMLVAVLLVLQVGFVVLLSRYLKQNASFVYMLLEICALGLVIHIHNRPGSQTYKIGWVVSVLALPVIGCILYFLWSGEIQFKRLAAKKTASWDEPESVRMRSEMNRDKLARDFPNWSRTASYLERRGYHLFGNTKVTYFPEGELLLRAITENIRRAEHFVFLEYFIVAEGEIWSQIESALCDCARRGVEVKVIFDDFGTLKRFRGETIEKLRAAGVEVVMFNPVHEYVNRLYFNYRDHRKIAVIDGNEAYTGGVNLADEYANIIERFGYWKDTGVRLTGDGAWGLTRAFMTMWKSLSGGFDRDDDSYRPNEPEKAAGYCQTFIDGPNNSPDNPARGVYLQMIHSARRFLYITTPYFIPDESVLHALCVAGDGGVDVRLMMPGIPDHWYADLVAESYFGELLRHGVKIYRYQPGFLHAKSVMVDREAAFVGTVNMDYRSFELHFECGTMLYGVPAIEELLEDMDHVVADSREVTLADWKKRGIFRRCFAPILRLFAAWM